MAAHVLRKIFPALGTVNTICLYGKPDRLEETGSRIKDKVLELHRMWSSFDPNSEVSKINEAAGVHPVRVSAETIDILELAGRCSSMTDGAFDVTLGALNETWRNAIREKCVPQADELKHASEHCGFECVQVDRSAQTVSVDSSNCRVDLGGIAKGWALDRAREIVCARGVESCLLNFGGTVAAVGRDVRVGVQNPLQPTGVPLGQIEVCDKVVVTSGVNEHGFQSGDKRYHHIIDPRTGWPAEPGLLQVTLVGDHAATADALATGALVLGVRRCLPVLQEQGFEAIFVTDRGEVQVTTGLLDTFTLARGADCALASSIG